MAGLRKVEEVERPEHLAFPKLTNPSFAREAAHIADLTRTLHAKAQPERDRSRTKAAKGSAGPPTDPFEHLRNKERADALIAESVELFFARDAALTAVSGLDKSKCKELAIKTLDKMRAHQVRCEDFDDLNFETSFTIYAGAGHQEVARSQLKNFMKSVAEV